MKVVERVLDVDSNMTGERVGMTIAADALAHIMSVLTDLYSNPVLAVIREYSTNAFDAHVEAGVKRPIEVTLPTALAPFFRVRDYGFGLNVEDIRNIYSQYGTSTKRDTNDAVGMLGLGCKSALTYTDQFTVSGTKDGVTTQVSVSRDEDGSGSMTIVAEYESDEPSGVEIIIPVKSHNNFERYARDFFRFWSEGTVLVNGEAPKRVDGIWLTEDLLLMENSDGYDYIVMGNVAYPMEHDYRNNYALVAFVPIGDVQFTPSREALQMTTKTKDAITAIKKRVEAEKDAAVERMVNEAPTKQEALTALLQANRLGFKTTPKYKGDEIPLVVKAPNDGRFIFAKVKSYYREKGWSAEKQIMAQSYRTSVWLTGYTSDTFSGYKREKLTQWAEKNNIKVDRFILVESVPPELDGWINGDTVKPWAEVEAEKIVRAKTALQSGRVSGSYTGYIDGDWQSTILAEDIDTTNPVVYGGKYDDRPSFLKKYTYVELGQNRIAKFKRDFPMAQTTREALSAEAKKWEATLTMDDLLNLTILTTIRANNLDPLKKLDETLINDSSLSQLVTVAKLKTDLLSKYQQYASFVTIKLPRWDNPTESYPLLTPVLTGRAYYDTISLTGKNADHFYLYVNAVHAAGTEA